MRINFDLKKFKIRHKIRQQNFPWVCLLPLFIIPFLILGKLAIADRNTSNYMRKVTQGEVPKNKKKPSYATMAWKCFKESSHTAFDNMLNIESPKKHSQLPSYHLTVGNNTLLEMAEAIKLAKYGSEPDVPEAKPYFNALLKRNNETLNCKIKLRGYSQWHHYMEKPSFRLKFPKEEPLDGQRFVDLQRPEDVLTLRNWLPNHLALQMGLIAERIEHVRLFINNKFFGVYLKTMRQGEPLAVKSGRMPGVFYKGERYHYFKWRDIKYWNRYGDESKKSDEVFTRFLTSLRTLTRNPNASLEKIFEDYQSLQKVLDLDSYARWAALMIVTGSIHTDSYHNHSYYLNNNIGKLEALVWDSNSYGSHFGPTICHPDAVMHPVMDMVIRDPRWVHKRNQAMYELMNGIAHPTKVLALVEQKMSTLLPDLKADAHLIELNITLNEDSLVRPRSPADIPGELEEINSYIKERHNYLLKYLRNIMVDIRPHPKNTDWTEVTLKGNAAVKMVQGNESQLLYPVLAKRGQVFGNRSLEQYIPNQAFTYLIKKPIKTLRFFNAITGEAIKPFSINQFIRLDPRTFPIELLKEPNKEDLILGPGVVVVDKDIHTYPGQALVIKAGTTVQFKKGIGLYAKGSTIAEGTEDKPIVLEPLKAKETWACFAVSGKFSKGSSFKHLKVHGGSLGSDGQAQFKGMFNVYNCPMVTLENCYFGKNFNSDDTVNLAESTILIKNCVWENANADALDLDICQGKVLDSIFKFSGNDGLDLMTCQVEVDNCQFIKSGDKGVSVGENSRLHITNSLFKECQFGLQAKDNSVAYVKNSKFIGNLTAINAYRKKPLFINGGQIKLDSCSISKSVQHDILIEKKSLLYFFNTSFNSSKNNSGAQRILKVDKAKDLHHAIKK